MTVSSAIGPTAQPPSAAAMANSNSGATIAQNFTTFLQLLTTQLRNQNPLEPLDTNQFTQQLVQFAQVEQQIGMNASLSALIALQYATQASAAMSFLGATVRVEGDTVKLANGEATWSFTAEKAATATINVYSATGELVHTEERTITAGQQSFSWNGRNAAGGNLPEGNYRVSITAKDASGQTVAVSTEVEGVVDGIDVTQSPPLLTIGGQTFTVDKIKQVRRQTTPPSLLSRMADALPRL
ncbi:MAG TPA: flagellar hook capping FlgD N-terminal domain-containing protein [Xanthobacteraceae bacterium]|nr:flagellar hook capping FlgD N-terminal domain-containing protein [Xanthobacteraceae bacterium]